MTKAEINLLPPIVKRERHRRLLGLRLSRLYWWFTLTLVVTVAALGIAWGVLWQTNQQLQQTAVNKLEQRHDTEVLRALNQLLGALQQRTSLDRPWFSEVVAVLKALPPELRVDKLAVAAGSEQLVIEGTTTSRAAVASFAERLKGLSWIEKVDAPLTNLVVGRDGSFSFTVQRKGGAL